MPYIYETLKPPPMETLAVAYLGPILAPMRVLTRVPPQSPTQDTQPANTFIRVDASSGTMIPDSIFFDGQIVLHSYAPYDEEVAAEDNIGTAVAWMGNVQGNTITAAGFDWYVTYSQVVSLGHRVPDPDVPLVRYRGAVRWRVAGQVIGPMGQPTRTMSATPPNAL